MMQNNDNVINQRPTANSSYGGKALDTYADLVIALGLALVMLVSIYIPALSNNLLRFALGIATVLFLPGYLFLATLFPGRGDLGNLERTVLSVGLSIVLVPFIGFILNYTTMGITAESMTLFVMLLIGVTLVLAFARRIMLPMDKRFALNFREPVAAIKNMILPASKDKSDMIVSALMICSILLVVAVLGYLIVTPYQADRYTEFFIYGQNGNMSSYPKAYVIGETKPVIVGIVNQEGGTREYDLAVTINSDNQSHRIYLDHFSLGNNETLLKTINLTPDRVGDMQNMEFRLYMDGSPADPYRQCNLWINVTAPAPANATVVENTTVAANATAAVTP